MFRSQPMLRPGSTYPLQPFGGLTFGFQLAATVGSLFAAPPCQTTALPDQCLRRQTGTDIRDKVSWESVVGFWMGGVRLAPTSGIEFARSVVGFWMGGVRLAPTSGISLLGVSRGSG
jgi:hypothetical protein